MPEPDEAAALTIWAPASLPASHWVHRVQYDHAASGPEAEPSQAQTVTVWQAPSGTEDPR